MSELKPCPFCGNEVITDVSGKIYCQYCDHYFEPSWFLDRPIEVAEYIYRVFKLEKENIRLACTCDGIGDALKKADTRIAELEAELAKMKAHFRQPTHGPCCTCQRCGQPYEDCRCDLDDVVDELDKANARIAELEAHIVALEEAAKIDEWDDFPNFPEPPEVRE